MKQKQFELQHETLWHNIELILVNDKKNKPEQYRELPCTISPPVPNTGARPNNVVIHQH